MNARFIPGMVGTICKGGRTKKTGSGFQRDELTSEERFGQE
jgi:hypothetical protein